MSSKLFDLTGRIALVTGSTSGLGLAMARGLAEAGATIVLNGRREERLASALASFREAGFSAHSYRFDVTSETDVEGAIAAIERDVGPIGILVNNAGIQRRAPLLEMPAAVWEEVLKHNLTGVFLVAKAVAKRMVTRNRGKIVNIASLSSEVARQTIGPYTASKGGVRQITKTMAIEWAPHNIQVNGLGPGYIRTELNTALHTDPEFTKWVRARTPAGRWGEPEDLIGAAIFLASDASDFVTGHILYVDGGVLASM